MSDSEIDELLGEFLVESYENLDRLDGELLSLEDDPGNGETLSSIFRTIHTIKGTCGFLDLDRLQAVTHVGENLLSSLREGALGINDAISNALLELVDAVREMLVHLEQHGVEGDETYAPLIERLESLNSVDESVSEPAESAAPTPSEPEDDDTPASAAPAPEATTTEPGVTATDPGTDGSAIASATIRVPVQQLDQLMNVAGELVLARNQILQIAANSEDPATVSTSQRLNLITTELQERIMKVRMQPIGSIWQKYPRVVRDLSRTCAKSIELTMIGTETELDKTLLEAIKDPLMHILRNAADHGIEEPAAREAVGKPGKGNLTLRAYHESGQVNIEIEDDGKGIPPDVLKAKALGLGLITPDEAANMSDRQAVHLIFHAGLSTASAVTNVSGRGVGMDVVRSNIEKIGGSVEVTSTPGLGTKIRIKIPLTLAIIPALIVTSAGDRYAIPQVNLVELVRLEGKEALAKIEDLNGCQIYRLRGELLPLVFLNDTLQVSDATDSDGELEREDDPVRNIIVVRADDQLLGIVVDEINDTEEIVVKPLDQQIKSSQVFAGTTILGDGHVALIIDVLGIAQRENVLREGRGDMQQDDTDEGDGAPTVESFLIVRPCEGRRLAIELGEVDRLEEFANESIEQSGSLEVVQYRGDVMPVFRLSEVLGLGSDDRSEPDTATAATVVRTTAGRSVGLIVDAITDIVETRGAKRRPLQDRGLSASIVIDGHVTDILDVDALIDEHLGEPHHAGPEENADSTSTAAKHKQLCTFHVGDLFFGVNVIQVQEVLRHQPMTRVPLTSDVVEGLINLRGQIVTALDMRRRLGLDDGKAADHLPARSSQMNVVLRASDEIVSVIVDRIGDVLELDESLHSRVPATIDPGLGELLTGVYQLDGQLLLELNVDRLVAVQDEPLSVA